MQNLRLRVFAGPNGSGKSTVIKSVKNYKINDKSIDFGIYINADDIAGRLRADTFSFEDYEISTTQNEFTDVALNSGLIGAGLDKSSFIESFKLSGNKVKLTVKNLDEHIAQIIADFYAKNCWQSERNFPLKLYSRIHLNLILCVRR